MRSTGPSRCIVTQANARSTSRRTCRASSENADLVGTDLTLAIHQTVLPDIEGRGGPSPYLEQLVADGKLGMKAGEGFRRWTPAQQQELRAKVLAHLKKAKSQEA